MAAGLPVWPATSRAGSEEAKGNVFDRCLIRRQAACGRSETLAWKLTEGLLRIAYQPDRFQSMGQTLCCVLRLFTRSWLSHA